MDRNVVILEGCIGDDMKYGKTIDGKEYATFTLLISPNHRDDEGNGERYQSFTMIRIMCFEKKQVEYLRQAKARSGCHVSIFARLSSHKSEYKGVSLIQNNVVVKDIHILKTK